MLQQLVQRALGAAGFHGRCGDGKANGAGTACAVHAVHTLQAVTVTFTVTTSASSTAVSKPPLTASPAAVAAGPGAEDAACAGSGTAALHTCVRDASSLSTGTCGAGRGAAAVGG